MQKNIVFHKPDDDPPVPYYISAEPINFGQKVLLECAAVGTLNYSQTIGEISADEGLELYDLDPKRSHPFPVEIKNGRMTIKVKMPEPVKKSKKARPRK